MPTDPLPLPPLRPERPDLPPRRPPSPGWMKAAFAFGLIPVFFSVCLWQVAFGGARVESLATGMNASVFIGLLFSLPMLGGLALASRFFSGNAARIGAGLGFAVLMVVGLGAVAYAGCMCMMSGTNRHN